MLEFQSGNRQKKTGRNRERLLRNTMRIGLKLDRNRKKIWLRKWRNRLKRITRTTRPILIEHRRKRLNSFLNTGRP